MVTVSAPASKTASPAVANLSTSLTNPITAPGPGIACSVFNATLTVASPTFDATFVPIVEALSIALFNAGDAASNIIAAVFDTFFVASATSCTNSGLLSFSFAADNTFSAASTVFPTAVETVSFTGPFIFLFNSSTTIAPTWFALFATPATTSDAVDANSDAFSDI